MKNTRTTRRILASSAAALVALCALPTAAKAQQFWDVNGAAAGFGGNGNWDLVTGNWNNATGAGAPQLWTNTATSDAVFQGTAGSVTQTAVSLTVRNMTFNVTGYTLSNSSAANPLTLAPGSTITVTNAGDTATITSFLVGVSGFTKAGPGTLQFDGSGTNAYTGTTTVNDGAVNLNKGIANQTIPGALAIGDGSGAAGSASVKLLAANQIADNSAVSFSADGKLDLNGFAETVGSLGGVASPGSSITLGANGALTAGGDNSSTIYSGTVTGTGTASITKNGTGIWTFGNAANSYTGKTLVNAGTLLVIANSALGLADGTVASNTTVASGATLQSGAGLAIGNEALTISGSGVAGVGGALAIVGGGASSSYAGAITLAANASITANGTTLTLTGGIAKPGFVLTLGATTAANGAGGTININTVGISGAVAGSDLIVESTTVNENVTNSYNGPTFIRSTNVNGSGILNANAASALPTANGRTVLTMDDAGSLGNSQLNLIGGFNQAIASLTSANTPSGLSSKVNLNSNALTIGTAAGTTNFFGTIRGTGSIIKDGTSTQILSGTNTYTGLTSVQAGTLQAGSTQAFGVNSLVIVANGAKLELAGFSNTIGVLSDGGVFPATGIVQNTLATGGNSPTVLTIAGTNGPGVGFGGTINQSGVGAPVQVVKNGAGTQSLSGQSNYSGGTILNAGTLDIDARSVAVGAVPSANPVLTGPLGTGTLTINGGDIGTGVGTGGSNVNNAIGNNVVVNGNFSVSNVVLPTAVLGAPSTNAGLPAPGTAVVNSVAFGSSGAATFSFASDGVSFTGPVKLNRPGTATVITTNSGFLDLSGTVSDLVAGTGGGLNFSGNTATYLGSSGLGTAIPGILGQVDASNTYAGLTTVTGGLVVLGKNTGATAIPGNLQINAGAAVWVDSSSAGTTANQIAVTSNVLVNGGLDLSGRNQTINALTGTGVVELDDINGAALGGASVFTVNSGNFGGIIFDNGAGGQLVKNSSGTLVLGGTNTYVGNTTVNAGNLIVNGSIASKNTIVNPLALLGGIGVVKGNVLNSGILSPGATSGIGVGKLTIGGNYTQTGTGKAIIEVKGRTTGQSDQVAVGGAANLGGSLRLVNIGNVRLQRGDKVTFLTATGGVNGQFATVNSDSFLPSGHLLKAGVVYHSNSVDLAAVQGSFANGLGGLTPNQKAVARNLDGMVNDHRANAVINFLDTELLGNLPKDLDRIAPEELASIFTIGISLANVQTANLERRMDDLQGGAEGFSASGYAMNAGGPSYSSAAGSGSYGPAGKGGKELRAPEDNRWGVFVTGVGEFTLVGSTANARGYDLTTGGFTIGVDYKLTPNFVLGLNTGYARSNADLVSSGHVTVDGAKLGLYATYFTGTGFYADAALSGGYNSYDTRRSALKGSANGGTNGGEFNALLATGYDWKTGGLTIGPVASVQYTYVGLQNFQEHGSLAPLKYNSQNGESLRTALGVKASYDWHTASGVVIRPEARASWQHEFGDSSFALDSRFASGAGNTFTVHGPQIGDDSLLVGAGLAVLWNERTSTYVYYDGELVRTNYNSHNVSGGVRLSF